MKTTINGYKLNKNGKPILSVPEGSLLKENHEGRLIKENGTYYFFTRKHGSKFLYEQ